MATASLIHAPCGYSRKFSYNLRNGVYGGAAGSTSYSPSSSSCSCCSSQGLNFSSGVKSNCKGQGLRAQAMNTTIQGNFASPKAIVNSNTEPDHLLVLVHGILASPSDWTYVEAELKRRLGRNFLIYASASNTYTKTFSGVDGAGKRLADEVMQVVKKKDSLKRISFLAHSLGGLFARYAIAVLYSEAALSTGQSSDTTDSTLPSSQAVRAARRGTIAGLDPINFITLATPHLGVRGRKQLPFLLGIPILEKLAPPIAPIFTGRTGSQLFLTDGKPNKPPLLLRMASDCEDGKFISALGAFGCRILYANVSYDHMVGWRTSSIRREKELVKPPRRSLDGYKHVVDVEYCPPLSSEGPQFPPEAVKAKEAAQKEPNTRNTVEYHEIMEEEMIHGLQQLGWKKVDVSFHSAFWPFFAHNNIHVKNEWLHNAGAGVIAHVADSLKQQETSSLIIASL
ncbi:putative lipase YDR444W isoform X3 [Jatropha curcas]|uniref:putative lipase YDR444W isoform X1 n=1 Tax=Jatropha curcas TaxID=180498 RepID=UPI001893F113|nr:putative lipase YDR444W isoform X1 [Jatropha curcas]XP_037494815.1 putative lipase YDR444W isoform X2 [Jatropha curcas]XP_037494816.1 putative lipase YDR444W isoform X3 [Jatropha curcas]